MKDDAVEIVGRAQAGGLLFTCEHASARVPAPWRPRPADRRLLATHWGHDLGAAAVTRELVRLTGGAGVLARFSRLLVDANRLPDDPTAVLTHTDDGDPRFNRTVDLAARIARFHTPYHAAIDALCRRARPRWIWSIHSFTPSFRGSARAMEAGVLFDQYDEVAEHMVRALGAEGLRTEPNQPYSGKVGLIYSANRHGHTHDVPYLELELRQDLITAERDARRIAAAVARAWRHVEG